MKRIPLLLFLGLYLFSSTTWAQKNAKAYMLYATFLSPGKGPYIETYITVEGKTLIMTLNANKKYQGAVEISMAFKLGEEIKAVKKYTLLSPEIDDTTGGLKIANFIDQQRIPISNGEYTLEVSITDKNNTAKKTYPGSMSVSVNFADDKVETSDIQQLESYTKVFNPTPLTKSGYDLIPYVSNFYPENLNKIVFYAEVYNTKKVLGTDERFVMEYYVESFENKVKISTLNGFNRQTSGSVNVLLTEFNIQNLPTGNYNLVLETKDKDNNVVCVKKTFFQRSNPKMQMNLEDIAAVVINASFVAGMNNMDTLADLIRSLRPISSQLEVNFAQNQLKGKDLKLMQQYFLNFWMIRNPANPQQAWSTYNQEVIKVQNSFGSKKVKGYDTDRGRVYLQYGPPDQRTQVPSEPSAYPYEVWQYYRLKGQTNRKFVFCDPDLATSTYRLIHSDALGEINDPRWDMKIHSRDSQSMDNQNLNAPNHFGGSSIDNFNNPR